MKPRIGQLAAAGAIVGFLAFGGITLAYAQDDTTTTQDPSAGATTDDGATTDNGTTTDEHCPDKGEGAGGSGAGRTPGDEPSGSSSQESPSTESPSAEAASL